MIVKTNSLPESIKQVVLNGGTEPPYSGEYNNFEDAGTYLCRQCGLALFRSTTKFHSQCGWPSFDENIQDAVTQRTDADGRRTEILCARCKAHLGHIFLQEGYTNKNVRHCVNARSLDFVPDMEVTDTEEGIFAAGCFWGVEYYMKKLPGVLKVESGYTGGDVQNPTYEEVCSKNTGHLEAVRVLYDPTKLDYESLCKYFFEIHDPTQKNGQGPDIGPQYLSAIFYYDEEQLQTAQKIMDLLKSKGFDVATKLHPVKPFYKAELYHQNYYAKSGRQPYCHNYEKKF